MATTSQLDRIRFINKEGLVNQSLVIGFVTGFRKEEIIVQLPDFRHGRIHFIGKTLIPDKSILKNQLIACQVKNNTDKLELSIDPTDINGSLELTNLQTGDIIWGRVAVKEDYGYGIDIGKQYNAFLKISDDLIINSYHFFTINKNTKRLVELSILDSSSIGKSISIGNLVQCKVEKQNSFGILVKLDSDSYGYISPFNVSTKTIGSKINARILFISPSNQIFLTPVNIFQRTSNIKVGDTCKCTMVSQISQICLFSFKKDIIGMCYKNDLNETSINPEKKIKLRVKDIDNICGILKLSNDQQFMKMKLVDINEIQVGQILMCSVISSNEYGWNLRISKYLSGFVLKILVGNTQLNIGEEVRCRVINVDVSKNKIILTSNIDLVDSSQPILQSYSIDVIDQWFIGFVEKIEPSYAIIKFYNNVSGLLHKSETTYEKGLDECLSLGLVISVRIVSVDEDHRRMVLSQLASSENNDKSIIRITNVNISHEITFDILPQDQTFTQSKSTIIDENHLSDFSELIPFIKQVLQKSPDLILNAVFLGKSSHFDSAFSTLKYSVLRTVQLNKFPKTFDELSVKDCLIGYISKINDFGLLINIGFNLVGFYPIRMPHDHKIGETILVRVKEIDHLKNRIILVKPKIDLVSSALPHLTFNGLVLSFLKEYEFISKHIYPKLRKLKVGAQFDVVVRDRIDNNRYICDWKKYSCTLFSALNTLKKGTKTEATCMYWDIDPFHVYFALNNETTSTDDTSVMVMKNFRRFSVGLSNGGQGDLVYLTTNPTILDNNQVEENSLVECSYVSSLNGIRFYMPKSSATSMNKVISCIVNKVNPTTIVARNQNQSFNIHVSTFGKEFQEGDRPLERFVVNDSITAYSIPFMSHEFRKYRQLSFAPNIVPFNPESLSPGSKVTVFIREYQTRQILVDINLTIKGFVKIVELVPLNNLKLEPIQKYPIGSVLKLIVAEYSVEHGAFNLVRKKSDPVRIGDIVIARVYNHDIKRNCLFLDLPNKYHGYIHVTNIYEDFVANPFDNFPVGTCVKCKVIREVNPNYFDLSIRYMHQEMPVVTLAENGLYECYVTKVTKSLISLTISQDIKGQLCLKTAQQLFGNGWNKSIKVHSVIYVRYLRSLGNINIFVPEVRETNIDLQEQLISNQCDTTPSLIQQPFSWDSGTFTGTPVEVKPMTTIIQPESTQPKNDKSLSEFEIRDIEYKLATNKLVPTTIEDFERSVISSPNSSIVWVNYMCFFLQSFELEKTRQIYERALKTISFREVSEIVNIYLSAINIECLYGTKESMRDLQARAANVYSKKKLITHSIELYLSLNQLDDAEHECIILKKLYPCSKKPYILYGKLLTSQKRFIEAKSLLKSALQNVNERKHTTIVLQFSLLEFKFGDIQRGITLIESILNNFPHRMDIWITYIDQLIKHQLIDITRNVFDRLLTISFKKTKLKTLYRKLLYFEQTYGDVHLAEQVKHKISQL